MLRVAVQSMNDSADKPKDALNLLLKGSEWDPRSLIDLCQQAYNGRVKDLELLQLIAAKEYDLLMAHTLEQAS
jgi:hypothetical protein